MHILATLERADCGLALLVESLLIADEAFAALEARRVTPTCALVPVAANRDRAPCVLEATEFSRAATD